jgi:hypothetical protein
MMTLIAEPGFWVLVGLPVVALLQFVAALRSRSIQRELLSQVSGILAEEGINNGDRAWLANALDVSDRHMLPVAALFAPALVPIAIIVTFAELWKIKVPNYGQAVDHLENDSDNLWAQIITLQSDIDPRSGNFWTDNRRRKIQDLSSSLESSSMPISSLWLAIWLVAALPFIAVIYAISGSSRYFVENMIKPLQLPVAFNLQGFGHLFGWIRPNRPSFRT